ncbi:hypothetical protein EV363DRAFT_1318759 [Boletus edulis]|nr:hypothetical protein EV363DRAFT_1318759 [Boletus edulis]
MSRRPSSSMPRGPSLSPVLLPLTLPYRYCRVRCDLKEYCPTTTVNGLQQPACSNCRERNIRCVDEFAEVKAVKLLRRGRRLQQVEARYGKVIDDDSALSSVEQEPASPTFSAVTSPTCCIPQMQPPFLTSSFFRRFCVQYPIIEPGEFASRYIAHTKGTAPLDIEGKMLAMLLVTWAASFGIDEFGNEDTEDGPSESIGNSHFVLDGGDKIPNSKRQARLLCTEAMIREILTLVDLNGLLRRPSWDGVKVLLLLLPLTHGIQGPLEHLTTHEAILSQVRALCNLNDSPSVNSGLGPYCDMLIRARIFWSAHVHEGITTGLNGGHLVLDDDDLASFQATLPPQYCASAAHSVTSSADSSCSSPRASPPLSPTFPFVTPLEPSHPRAALAYLVTTQYFSLTLAVSKACRAIHSTLTGPRARRQTDAIRGESVSGHLGRTRTGWQIFIFGCLNTIREALRNLTGDNHSNHAVAAALYLSAIGQMLQRHLKVPSSFFAYDTGLIRDGCFFAGLLLAQSDKLGAELGAIRCNIDWEEGVAACLQALGEVRWVCYRSQEQEKTLKAEWEARIERDSRRHGRQSPRPFPIKQSPGHSPCLNDNTPLPCTAPSTSNPQTLSLVAAGGQVRPHLPPLSVSFTHDDSGPDTVLTDDGSGGWEPYTPPSTSGSLTGTVVTHRSLSPSPHQSIMGPMRGMTLTTDHFSFAVERTPDSQSSVGSGTQARWTPFGGDYLDPRIILAASDVVGCDDGFTPFGSNRQSYFV